MSLGDDTFGEWPSCGCPRPPSPLRYFGVLGAMMVGMWIAMVMYGIMTLQTYHYYYNYPKDRRSIKWLVATVWILDSLHVVFMCHSLYYYLIQNFGQRTALVAGNWSLYASIVINITIAFVVQAFFTQRIYKLCRRYKWWISGVIGFTVFAHFVFGMETVIFMFIRKEFSELQQDTFYAALPFAVFVVLSDILISTALCMFLDNSRSGYEDTNSIINRLIVFSINRCVAICVVAIVELVVFIAKPHSLYVFAIDFIVGKLYANSLMASLNSRTPTRPLPRSVVQNSSDLSTSFNLATMPSTVRTDTTADVRAEHIVSFAGTEAASPEEKPSRMPPMATDSESTPSNVSTTKLATSVV